MTPYLDYIDYELINLQETLSFNKLFTLNMAWVVTHYLLELVFNNFLVMILVGFLQIKAIHQDIMNHIRIDYFLH